PPRPRTRPTRTSNTHARAGGILEPSVTGGGRLNAGGGSHAVVQRGPAGQHLGADRADHRDGGDDDQTRDQRVLENLTTVVVGDETADIACEALHSCVPLRKKLN